MFTAKKTQKSPLVYPNDRPGATSVIISTVADIVTPFLGGGSAELGLTARDYSVTAYTEYRLLYDFWKCALQDPEKLYKMASSFHPIGDPRMFTVLQKKVYQPDDEYLRSALFYVLNHCTEDGTTTAGKMQPGHPRFNEMRLNQLASFEADPFNIELENYKAAIETQDYLVGYMPDYMPTNLVGAVIIPESPQINHKKFAKLIKARQSEGWTLLYKYHEDLLELYADCDITLFGEGYRPTTNPSRAKEVMIVGP